MGWFAGVVERHAPGGQVEVGGGRPGADQRGRTGLAALALVAVTALAVGLEELLARPGCRRGWC